MIKKYAVLGSYRDNILKFKVRYKQKTYRGRAKSSVGIANIPV